ncbi:MAG: MotA/TolQ/ExbB proton channel family protein [Phycisphaerales bacterium]
MTDAYAFFVSLLERGGWVMLPLSLLSVVSVTLCVERAWFWIRTHRRSQRRRLSKLAEALRHDRRDEADKLVRRGGSIYERVARRLLRDGASEGVIAEAIELERPAIERFMTTLSTIITAAPLLGILGTVTGIIGSFQLLGESSLVTDPRAVSGGIAEALITTAAGLVIAIVTLFPYVVFKAQVDRALGRLEVLIAAARQSRNLDSGGSALD